MRQIPNGYLTKVLQKHKLKDVTNENQGHDHTDPSLTAAELNDLEVELSKVEATMQALADGVEISAATSWLNEA